MDENEVVAEDPKPTEPNDQVPEEYERKIAAAEAELQKFKAADKKRKADESAAKKKSEDEAALARGEHERLLAEQAAQLTAQQERVAQYEAAAQARIDAAIEKLPDAAKAELELVKDALPIEKLETLVQAKLEAQGATPQVMAPPAGITSGRARQQSGHKISADTEHILEETYAPESVYEISKHLGTSTRVSNTGSKEVKFGWGFKEGGDDKQKVAAFIELMRRNTADPLIAVREARRASLLK